MSKMVQFYYGVLHAQQPYDENHTVESWSPSR